MSLSYKISKRMLKIKVEIQWLLYKLFFVRRMWPCGRTEKDSFLCCQQPMKTNRIYFSFDGKKCYCKVCGRMRIQSSDPLDKKDPWGFRE